MGPRKFPARSTRSALPGLGGLAPGRVWLRGLRGPHIALSRFRLSVSSATSGPGTRLLLDLSAEAGRRLH